jgi:hypothetical protein
MEVDDEAHSSNQIHGRNWRKTPQITRSKIRPKYLWKSRKRKTLQHEEGDDSIQKHNYVDVNQEFTRCGNHPNILPLFGKLGEISHFSPFFSKTWSTPTPSKKWKTKVKGLREGIQLAHSHNSPMVLIYMWKIKD